MTIIAIIAAALASLLLFSLLVQILRGGVLTLAGIAEAAVLIAVLVFALRYLGVIL